MLKVLGYLAFGFWLAALVLVVCVGGMLLIASKAVWFIVEPMLEIIKALIGL